ncbi:MAG: ribonuclease III [Desulfobacterales bacterium]|nr:ribonuclease III [Desulfobacterales bacterium]
MKNYWKLEIGNWKLEIRRYSSFKFRVSSCKSEFSKLEKRLLYEFKDKSLLDEARRHSSYVNEQAVTGMRDNECFEFLGDAVLNLIVGHILMDRYPEFDEGDLSRMRASLVNEAQLASIARTIDIGTYMRLGKGEIQTDGQKKNSILADAFEAIIAAVYLDGGFKAAFRFIECHFSAIIDAITRPDSNFDYKSQLQEVAQVSHKVSPVYEVLEEIGPDHDKTFIARIKVGQVVSAEGVGKSKKMAEQNAAEKALNILKIEN